jgi:hypothetical protein
MTPLMKAEIMSNGCQGSQVGINRSASCKQQAVSSRCTRLLLLLHWFLVLTAQASV